VRDLLNVAGQSFIISGFVLFILVVPLYFIYPPLYTGPEDYATNLLFFTQLGFVWTFVGIYPIMLSMAIKEIEVGDLVFYSEGQLSWGPGIVLEKDGHAPTGFMDEEDRRLTAPQYKVAWQEKQVVDWHWEGTISHYEEVRRGEH